MQLVNGYSGKGQLFDEINKNRDIDIENISSYRIGFNYSLKVHLYTW